MRPQEISKQWLNVHAVRSRHDRARRRHPSSSTGSTSATSPSSSTPPPTTGSADSPTVPTCQAHDLHASATDHSPTPRRCCSTEVLRALSRADHRRCSDPGPACGGLPVSEWRQCPSAGIDRRVGSQIPVRLIADAGAERHAATTSTELRWQLRHPQLPALPRPQAVRLRRAVRRLPARRERLQLRPRRLLRPPPRLRQLRLLRQPRPPRRPPDRRRPHATPVPEPTAILGFTTEILGRNHILNANQTIEYGFCPPTSGDHYNIAGVGPIRAAVYPNNAEQPPGGWVHNMEHGWVVQLYSCKNGCPSADEMAQMTAFFNQAPPPDPAKNQGCTSPRRSLSPASTA